MERHGQMIKQCYRGYCEICDVGLVHEHHEQREKTEGQKRERDVLWKRCSWHNSQPAIERYKSIRERGTSKVE